MSCFSRFFSPEQKHTSKDALNSVVWLLEIRCHVPFSKEILTPVLAEEQETSAGTGVKIHHKDGTILNLTRIIMRNWDFLNWKIKPQVFHCNNKVTWPIAFIW